MRQIEERVHKFNKDEILVKMRERREAHRALFEEALEGYFTTANKVLEELKSDLLSRRRPDFYRLVRLTIPEDHTNDYDAVIEMLEMSTGNEVELTEEEFRSYVRDEWDWKGQFTQSIAAYTAQ